MTSKSTENSSVDKKDSRRASTSKRESSPEPKRARKELTVDDRRRGQRLFGMVLGTLNQRKTEIQKKSDTDIKREEIHKRLQQKITEENNKIAEDVRKENRSRQEIEARRKLVGEHIRATTKRKHKRELDSKMVNFLATCTNPLIYYLPYKLTDAQKQKIQSQKEEMEKRFAEEIKEEEEWKKQDKEFLANLNSIKNRPNAPKNNSQDNHEDGAHVKKHLNPGSPINDNSDNNKNIEKDPSPNSLVKEQEENDNSTENQSKKDSNVTSPMPVENNSEPTEPNETTDKDIQVPNFNEPQPVSESKSCKSTDSSPKEEKNIDTPETDDKEVDTDKIENNGSLETKSNENNNVTASSEQQQDEDAQLKEVIQD